MSDHSPTPWLLDGRLVYALEVDPRRPYFKGAPNYRNCWSAQVQGPAPEAELEAIARKMQAAPDLLEACIALIRSDDLQRAIDLARAAIAKAEGKP